MREKLIELLSQVQHFGIKRTHRMAHPTLPKNEEIADYLIANGVTVVTDNNVGSKWIPVTERLPEDDLPKDSTSKQIKVLVAYMRNGNWVVRTNLRQKGQGWRKPDQWGWSVSDPISHWMPLPEPPKGE